MSQNGTPLRQMTITESFKHSKPKMKEFKIPHPYTVSDVCIEIDSDSDLETPPQFDMEDVKPKLEDLNLERLGSNKPNSMGTPSPPKKPRIMIGVNKPGTSTPKAPLPDNSINLSPVMPHISRVESLNERYTNCFADSPTNQDGYDSDKTIPYNCNTSFSDESTVPFSPNKEITSKSKVNIQEILVMNDSRNFCGSVEELFGWNASEEPKSGTLKVNRNHSTAAKRLDFSGIIDNNHSATNTNQKKNSTESNVEVTKTNTKKQRKPRAPKTPASKKENQKDSIRDTTLNATKTPTNSQRKRKIAKEVKPDDAKTKRIVKENFSPNQNLINTSSKLVIHQNIPIPAGGGAVISPKILSNNTQISKHISQNSKYSYHDAAQGPTKNIGTPGGSGLSKDCINGSVPLLNSEVIRKGPSNSNFFKQPKNLDDIINKLKSNKELSLTLEVSDQKHVGASSKQVTPKNHLGASIKGATPTTGWVDKKTTQSKPQAPIRDEKRTPHKATPRKIVVDEQQPCCSKSLVKKTPMTVKTTASSAKIDSTINDVVNGYSRTNTTTPEKASLANINATINDVVNGHSRTNNSTNPEKASLAKIDSTINNVVNGYSQKQSPAVASPKKGSPRKKLFGSPGKRSPTKNREIKSFKSKEGKQLQVKQLDELEKLFKEVAKKRHLKSLLDDKEYNILCKFVRMVDNQKYVVMKLFVWKRLFYNTVTFCKKAQMELNDKDMLDIFEYLREEGFVEAEYKKSASLSELLENLDIVKVKEIMAELKIKPMKNKTENISKLLMLANKQTTLTYTKSFRDLIMDKIEKKLGLAFKIKQEVLDTFYNAFLLGTFTNRDFHDVQVYFNSIIHQNVVFPEVAVEEYPVFYSRDKFLSYCRAIKMRRELDEMLTTKKKELKPVGIHNIGVEAYNKLYDLVAETSQDDHIQAPHLKRFTAQHVYVGILSDCCQHIFSKQNGFPQDVRKWLSFLISHFPKSKRLGKWYNKLVGLHMRHLDEINYELAAKLLIEALDTNRQALGEIAIYDLGALGQLVKSSKKHRIDQLYHDRIVQLVPRDIDTPPQTQIDAQCIRSDESGKKRVYIDKNRDGMTIKQVEMVAKAHYIENGYPHGEQSEGAHIKALLVLFFWDIIYNPKTTIPGTFISKIQTAPLDMFTHHFYQNRKDLIDERLREIGFLWPDGKVIEFAANNWQNHSHERSCFGMVMDLIKDVLLVEVLITVINRKVLAKIFERLIKNLGEFSSGMPDLLMWNVDEKKCKFVEVKGEGDRLQTNQKLWLQYLMEIGASIEVCWVHSTGSKRKKIKKVQVENDEAGPSSKPDN